MATKKDEFLLSKKKPTTLNSFGENNSKYSNFNLNQSRLKCSSNSFQTSFQTNSTKKHFIDSDFSHENQKEWNKSMNNGFKSKRSDSFILDESDKSNQKQRWKKTDNLNSTKTNSSTLSLYIAAYENSNEVTNKSKNSSKNAKKLSNFHQDSFEFPRYPNKEGGDKKPEVMQYKSSQKLLNPNEKDKSNDTTENNQTPQKPVKKSGWRRLIAKFRRKPKPSAETTGTSPAQTSQNSNDTTQQESEGPGGYCVKKKKRNENDEEIAVEANTSWRRLRKTRSMEGTLDGKSSKKVRSMKKQRQKKKKQRPSKETVDDTTAVETTQTQDQTQDATIDVSTKTPKHQQKEEELDQSRKISRKKSPSKEGDDLSLSKSVQRGFRNFRDKRAKDFRTVKTFISRKYQPHAMEKVVAEVEARKQRRTEPSQDTSPSPSSTKLHHGDDVFPQRRPHKKSNRSTKQPSNDHKNAPVAKPYLKPEKSFETDGLVLIETNNNNDGQLFLPSGRPFWQQHGKGKPGETDDDDELTDDELPMNAEVILDVHRGKIKLTDMPATSIVLDPYGPTMSLEEHDNTFFTRDLIFSNTVRSMINLNDELADHLMKKTPATRKCQFEVPHQVHRYSRAHPDDFKTEHFVPKHAERK